MIGQGKLQSQLFGLIHDDKFPRFAVFIGPRGSGKKTLINWICTNFRDKSPVIIDRGEQSCLADSVRQSIADAHRLVGSQVILVFADADNMSQAARNAMLKLTEEPPNNAYIIMTVEDSSSLLETIQSRATIFYMQPYSREELCNYCSQLALSDSDMSVLTTICENPGEIKLLYDNYNVQEFIQYVNLVLDNIADVSIANSFKIASKVALKDGEKGYDLKLFWKAFMVTAFSRLEEHYKWSQVLRITSQFLSWLRIKGANKQMLMDNWIIAVREVLQDDSRG